MIWVRQIKKVVDKGRLVIEICQYYWWWYEKKVLGFVKKCKKNEL